MINPILEISNLRKSFTNESGVQLAVDGISFQIAASECLCLLGPNGAGKTTTIMMTLGFLKPSDGDIKVCGHSVVTHPNTARKFISYIPDEVALYPTLSGYDNLKFFDALLDSPDRSEKELELVAERIGLTSVMLLKPVKSYSKGMKQRLGIAVALLKNSSLFIFDEPTNGLDAVGIKEFIQIIATLKQLGCGILVTTHDLLRVSSFANKVIFLKGGLLQKSFSGNELQSLNLEDEYLKILNL